MNANGGPDHLRGRRPLSPERACAVVSLLGIIVGTVVVVAGIFTNAPDLSGLGLLLLFSGLVAGSTH